MKITYVAVMNLTVDKRGDVRDKGYKVAKGIDKNSATFGAPTDPAISDFLKDCDILKDDIAAEDSPKTRAKSEAQAEVVFGGLKKYLVFVNNGPAQGIKDLLMLSEFEINKEKVVHPIPRQMVIKKIVDGISPNSAKITLTKKEAEDTMDRYKVETSADGATWILVLEVGDSRKLVVPGLKKSVELFYRVTGGNTHGFGKPSEAIAFSPR